MREQPHYTDILTIDFFEEYYNRRGMSFSAIHEYFKKQGQSISISTLSKYARRLGFEISASKARRRSDPKALDYDVSYLSPKVLETIDGFLLGDGFIRPSKSKVKVAELGCGVEHEGFCKFMMSGLSAYNSSCKCYKSSSMAQGFIWSGRTRSHPELYDQYQRWYPQPKNEKDKRVKQVPHDVRLTPISMMLWYLGDGSAVQEGDSLTIRLSTDGFAMDGVEFLASKLNNELGILCHRNNDNRIYIETRGIPAFFVLIGKESPIKCYQYKFDIPEWRFTAKRMKEVANELGIDYQHLAYLVKIGRISCYRASEKGRPRFLPQHITAVKEYFAGDTKVKKLVDWLKNIGASPEINCQNIIAPLNLDIVDRRRKLAIEFNESHFHSEASLDRSAARKKHIEKTRACTAKGIRLIHIFEHTYSQKEKQIKNFVKSALGLNKTRIPARKCSVTDKDGGAFLNEYHIQGKPQGVLRYFNLGYNNEIVGCMTASKHHEKTSGGNLCILSRLAFKENVTVQGGASRLFKHLVDWARMNNFESIVSWSDNCISDGGVYKVLGFRLEREYPPSYFYYDSINQVYRTKQSQRKTNKDRPKDMTIVDWNNSRNMFAIWDCGKKKWVYKLSKKVTCTDEKILDQIALIKENLSFDLIKKKYRGPTSIHGACYIASEALYHLLKDNYSLEIKRHKLDGITHWWLETKNEIIDPTAEQFDFDYPYQLGKKAVFLTNEPSRRCKLLLEKTAASAVGS